MYTPRLQYADQPVLRPQRAMTDMPQRQTKKVSPKQSDSSLNSIFRRLANSGSQDQE
ncbi:hypothetical protein ACO0LF_00775 [Undibacterium sp. Di27W]|uniref:hypothetical protein n=1 Tax=Undibacterium sp. Di27W TaxID=3413036 RepID=UPI003BF13EDA